MMRGVWMSGGSTWIWMVMVREWVVLRKSVRHFSNVILLSLVYQVCIGVWSAQIPLVLLADAVGCPWDFLHLHFLHLPFFFNPSSNPKQETSCLTEMMADAFAVAQPGSQASNGGCLMAVALLQFKDSGSLLHALSFLNWAKAGIWICPITFHWVVGFKFWS